MPRRSPSLRGDGSWSGSGVGPCRTPGPEVQKPPHRAAGAAKRKQGCYVNNGKYGYFLTCDKKNYKIPEWLNPDEITLDMAERLIAYKKKISEEWLEKQNNNKNDESENETESDKEPIKKVFPVFPFLLKRKYKRLNLRLKSKTKIPNWMPCTKTSNSLK